MTPTSSASSVTSTSSSSTTNAYLSALTRELLSLCLQYTTSDGSLATGGLGVWTYLQYQQACVAVSGEDDPWRMLSAARDAALDALRALEGNEDGASWNIYTIGNNKNNNTSMSLHTNPQIGCHAMLAAIYHQLLQMTNDNPETLNQQQEYRQFVQYHTQQVLSILQTTSDCRNDSSVWTGMAGGIQTILFLRQHTHNPYLGQDLVLNYAQQLLIQGRAAALEYQRKISTALPPHVTSSSFPTLLWKTSPEISQDQPFEYDLGMSHGLVGILTTLLALTRDEWQAVETVSEYDMHADTFRHARQYIKQTVDALPHLACHVSSGNLRAQLDNVLQEVDRQVSVAYGAPGHILLLLSANAFFQQPQYLHQARHLADEVVWARRIVWSKTSKSGLGLLHGISGNAYVLLQLSQALADYDDDGSKIFRSRAEHLARHAVQHWRELLAISSSAAAAVLMGSGQQHSSLSSTMHSPYSLMGGLGSLVSLLIDLNHLASNVPVKFPLLYQYPSHVSETRYAKTPSRMSQKSLVDTRPLPTFKYDTDQSVPPVQFASNMTRNLPSPQRNQRQNQAASPAPREPIRCQPSSGNAESTMSPTDKCKAPVPSNKVDALATEKTDEQEDRKASINGFQEKEALISRVKIPTGQVVLMLDEEDHHKAPLSRGSTNLEDNDEAEFPLPQPEDVPNERYLRMQLSLDDDNLYESEDGRRQHSNPPLLDEEDHRMAKKKHEWTAHDDNFDEFQESTGQEAPDQRFLRLQDSDDEGNMEQFYAHDGSALNPNALDDEGHVISSGKQKNGFIRGHEAAGISDFANADKDEKPDQRFLQMQDPDIEDLEDVSEFQGPEIDDMPDETFLQRQDSYEAMYYTNNGASQNKGLLDEEDLLRNNRRIIASAREEAETDEEEFVESGHDDMPVEDYLRSQDSADEMFFRYDGKENPPLLDEEAHYSPTTQPRKQNSSELSMSDEEFSEQDYNFESYRPPVPMSSSSHSTEYGFLLEEEGDGDEFQTADVSDEPNLDFLQGNMSVDELSIESVHRHHQESAVQLDDNGHQSMDMVFLETTGEQDEFDESDEFGETDVNEVADPRYLSRQDSANAQYFDHHKDQERLLEAKTNVRLLAKDSADQATQKLTDTTAAQRNKESKITEGVRQKVFPTPTTPCKKKGKKADFKNSSLVRGTPVRSMEAATAALSTSSRAAKPELSPKSYLDLASSCFEKAIGQGSLLNGGIGISVYLRIKLSELETDPSKSEEHLKTALKHAQRAVDDSMFDDGGGLHLSFISNDALGAQCLLVSIFRRLGKIDDAQNVARTVLKMLEDLLASDEKHDCSVLFGLAGALQAIWFLRNELSDMSFGSDLALTVSSAILLNGLEHSEKIRTSSLLMWEWHGRSFLGAGTGVVGILYSILGHNEEEWDSLNEYLPRVFGVLRQCIDSLTEHVLESGNLKAAVDGFEEDKSTDWTHGAPGYCLLLLRAYQVYGDVKYLIQAKHMGEEVIWPRRMQRRGLGLSRGVSGVAYVLLALARVDTENCALWRARAMKMAQLAFADLEELQEMSKNPDSLFEGTGGLVSLLIDMELSASDVYFPFFEYPLSLPFSKKPEKKRTAEKKAVETQPSHELHKTATSAATAMLAEENHKGSSVPSHQRKATPLPAKDHSASVTRTVTTAGTTSAKSVMYKTPPRPTGTLAISPLTEPSPGPPSQSTYPLTKSKTLSRRQPTQVEKVRQLERKDNHQRLSTKVWPPQVKRHIFTHPLNVPLADQPTASWLAKLQSMDGSVDSMESFDIFTRASIEWRLRAEASWLKVNGETEPSRRVHLEKQDKNSPVSTKKPFRRPDGVFSPSSSIHRRADESLDEKMAHVMEELSERLEDMEMIM
ncbi:lanthionine synthetase C-like protein [Nitzschia inconspicua]|uniref:Lanthionine synthetase C-like protein n=1 Tax=Nitzschia inconspicua TaxID=303405 RepID=A0A9K3LHG1_9STRA|nr:lanthionine synthetase C-like protein [Nitzschia inconspicua]KAG7362147.1 lanthionine synthetase C-like protein [Nitzschia inconspicua]